MRPSGKAFRKLDRVIIEESLPRAHFAERLDAVALAILLREVPILFALYLGSTRLLLRQPYCRLGGWHASLTVWFPGLSLRTAFPFYREDIPFVRVAALRGSIAICQARGPASLQIWVLSPCARETPGIKFNH
jgi:hypothetical protein